MQEAYTHAGPEIGVASTKAFMGQMLVFDHVSTKVVSIEKDSR